MRCLKRHSGSLMNDVQPCLNSARSPKQSYCQDVHFRARLLDARYPKRDPTAENIDTGLNYVSDKAQHQQLDENQVFKDLACYRLKQVCKYVNTCGKPPMIKSGQLFDGVGYVQTSPLCISHKQFYHFRQRRELASAYGAATATLRTRHETAQQPNVSEG